MKKLSIKQLVLNILPLLLGVFLLTNCNKTVVEYNKNFEGRWISDNELLSGYVVYTSNELIFEGKKGTFRKNCKDTCATVLCDCLVTFEGRADINQQGNLIKIQSNTPITISIDQKPFQESDGSWSMQVDGKYYRKQ
jgi:hypothetical protein